MQMQEYDLNIRHINGTSNFLADTISRNPAVLSDIEIKGLSQPWGIMVAALNLGIDSSVRRNLRGLAAFQARDPKILKIMQALKQQHAQSDGNYLLRHDVLYSKDSDTYPYWRPVLPAELESQVIKSVHVSLGHGDAEKCMVEIANTFHVRRLGRKVRKLISHSELST
jgi:hypothetical protein